MPRLQKTETKSITLFILRSAHSFYQSLVQTVAMKYATVASSAFFVFFSSASAHDLNVNRRHAEIAHKRQVVAALSSAPSSVSTPFPSVSGASGVIPLSQITSGMPSETTYGPSSTYSGGSIPTYFPAPALPPPCELLFYTRFM
jgi:hypothetical protein